MSEENQVEVEEAVDVVEQEESLEEASSAAAETLKPSDLQPVPQNGNQRDICSGHGV